MAATGFDSGTDLESAKSMSISIGDRGRAGVVLPAFSGHTGIAGNTSDAGERVVILEVGE